LGQPAEAASAYRRALALQRELDLLSQAAESQAGLARLALAGGDVPGALALAEEILAYLQAGSLDGADAPARVYLTCYQVLRAAGDGRAQATLQAGYDFVQGRAGRIPDPSARRSFLEAVPHNRDLLAAWASQVTALEPPA
jgi:hypothetical protein